MLEEIPGIHGSYSLHPKTNIATRPNTFTVPVAPVNTHIVGANAHIRGVEKFAQDLSSAVQAAWSTRHASRYSDVQVLILSWKDDDLGVAREIKELRRVFYELFSYGITEWKIPSDKPERRLGLQVGAFLDEHDQKDHLLIVYYAGHGCLNEQRVPLWAARKDSDSPTLPSSSVQSQLEEADADVLLLLDCCHAAHPTLTDSNNGVTEAISACGFETIAPGVGQHSFTNALIQELEIASQEAPISAARLHGRILWRLKTWKPALRRDSQGNLLPKKNGVIPLESEKRVTAVHCFLTNEPMYRSIKLAPLRRGPDKSDLLQSQASSSPSFPLTIPVVDATQEPSSNSHVKSPKSSTDGMVLNESKRAQVLISISVDSDMIDSNYQENVKVWKEILSLLPEAATEIKVEGLYGSFSTLSLVSMPVATWNLLPDIPGYSFVGFITKNNQIHKLERSEAKKAPDVSTHSELLHDAKFTDEQIEKLQTKHKQDSVTHKAIEDLQEHLLPIGQVHTKAKDQINELRGQQAELEEIKALKQDLNREFTSTIDLWHRMANKLAIRTDQGAAQKPASTRYNELLKDLIWLYFGGIHNAFDFIRREMIAFSDTNSISFSTKEFEGIGVYSFLTDPIILIIFVLILIYTIIDLTIMLCRGNLLLAFGVLWITTAIYIVHIQIKLDNQLAQSSVLESAKYSSNLPF